MFKRWRRNQLNEKMKSQIKFNRERIHSFSTIDDDRAEMLVTSSISICEVYDDDYLIKIVERYDVDKELVNKSRETAMLAMNEFDNAKKRYYDYSKEIDEKIKVGLYKKAILELKTEGLL